MVLHGTSTRTPTHAHKGTHTRGTLGRGTLSPPLRGKIAVICCRLPFPSIIDARLFGKRHRRCAAQVVCLLRARPLHMLVVSPCMLRS
jgi:hypothetical protein